MTTQLAAHRIVANHFLVENLSWEMFFLESSDILTAVVSWENIYIRKLRHHATADIFRREWVWRGGDEVEDLFWLRECFEVNVNIAALERDSELQVSTWDFLPIFLLLNSLKRSEFPQTVRPP